MKTAYLLVFPLVVIAGGLVLFHSFNNPESAVSLASGLTAPTETPPQIAPKTQIITATYGPPLGFFPTQLTVKTGQPVRLEVSATEDGRGCMSTITIPGLNNKIQVFRKNQTNIFEFTPQTPGKYAITCAMGIPHGFIVVE